LVLWLFINCSKHLVETDYDMLNTLTSDPCKALFNLSSYLNSSIAERSPNIVFPDDNVAKIPFTFKEILVLIVDDAFCNACSMFG